MNKEIKPEEGFRAKYSTEQPTLTEIEKIIMKKLSEPIPKRNGSDCRLFFSEANFKEWLRSTSDYVLFAQKPDELNKPENV